MAILKLYRKEWRGGPLSGSHTSHSEFAISPNIAEKQERDGYEGCQTRIMCFCYDEEQYSSGGGLSLVREYIVRDWE